MATFSNTGATAISIHAPPRGATFSACKEIIMERSFQFTPLREGRLDIRLLRSRRCYFNSRPSARGDAVRRGRRPERGRISIHAPPRGATLYAEGADPNEDVFQFTPLREGRQAPAPAPAQTQAFQFTPLREGRRAPPTRRSQLILFQFTPLREGRLKAGAVAELADLFQFTPLREGRRDCRKPLSAT